MKVLNNYSDFLKEELESDAVGYKIGKYLYHVTDTLGLEKIKSNGLIPQDGITIRNEKFSNRLYLATSLISAYDLSINFSSYRDNYEYFILKLDSKFLKNYKIDPLFKHGIYINYGVDKENIIEIINTDDLFDVFDDDDLDNLY